MASEVRLATSDDDIAAGWRAVGTAFLDAPSPELVTWRREMFSENRMHVAVDDGVVCGVASAFLTPLTLPGLATVTMGAVTGVGVLPTHRRRGHLSRLMEQQLSDIADQGAPIAGLIAAEWPIYGRYGYGMAIPGATYEVDTRLARFIDEGWHGTVELVDLPTIRDLSPPVFEAHRAATPGSIGRSTGWWDANRGVRPPPDSKPDPGDFRAIHRASDGVVDGYAVYTAKGRWERSVPSGRLEVRDLVTTTPGAYADLWRFLCEVDWTTSVKASPRPVDEPLAFQLADGRAVQKTHEGDHIWLRLLDVPAVLAARSYATSGSVVLDVVDDTLARGGRFELVVSPDGAACTSTTREADVTMSIASLAAASMGGTAVSTLSRAGLLDEQNPGAAALLDAMLRCSPAPFCSTNF
jgi:predicted acetyltransferase